jgi:hypothetical protein
MSYHDTGVNGSGRYLSSPTPETRQEEKSMNDDELDSFAKTLQQKTDDGKRER